MGTTLTLTSSDGFTLSAYRADPTTPARGGVVVVQEIFGVNSHIRSVVDRFAALGYVAIAPALFDRLEPGFETGYTAADMPRAMQALQTVDKEKALLDIAAAVDVLKAAGLKVCVTGYCMGGMLAFRTATHVEGLAAASCYYGGGIANFAHEVPLCPTDLHFGLKDSLIPPEQVAIIKAARSDVGYYFYDADHGFNCDQRGSYDAESAQIAWARTIRLFDSATA